MDFRGDITTISESLDESELLESSLSCFNRLRAGPRVESTSKIVPAALPFPSPFLALFRNHDLSPYHELQYFLDQESNHEDEEKVYYPRVLEQELEEVEEIPQNYVPNEHLLQSKNYLVCITEKIYLSIKHIQKEKPRDASGKRAEAEVDGGPFDELMQAVAPKTSGTRKPDWC
uniref:Intraflagellar transport protein 52 homolog n=1 Tax=Angiostrongylus cantonensis TaxID=6313 RepID=A0A0K0DGB7_ANGCA